MGVCVKKDYCNYYQETIIKVEKRSNCKSFTHFRLTMRVFVAFQWEKTKQVADFRHRWFHLRKCKMIMVHCKNTEKYEKVGEKAVWRFRYNVFEYDILWMFLQEG